MRLTEEERVTRRCHEITSWVTANDEVTRSVDTHEVVREVVRRSTALQRLPEGLVVGALEERHNIVVLQPSFAGEAGDVASETARVVCKTIVWRSEVLVGVDCRAFRARELKTSVKSCACYIMNSQEVPGLPANP